MSLIYHCVIMALKQNWCSGSITVFQIIWRNILLLICLGERTLGGQRVGESGTGRWVLRNTQYSNLSWSQWVGVAQAHVLCFYIWRRNYEEGARTAAAAESFQTQTFLPVFGIFPFLSIFDRMTNTNPISPYIGSLHKNDFWPWSLRCGYQRLGRTAVLILWYFCESIK